MEALYFRQENALYCYLNKTLALQVLSLSHFAFTLIRPLYQYELTPVLLKEI